jgi:hypothetical protein
VTGYGWTGTEHALAAINNSCCSSASNSQAPRAPRPAPLPTIALNQEKRHTSRDSRAPLKCLFTPWHPRQAVHATGGMPVLVALLGPEQRSPRTPAPQSRGGHARPCAGADAAARARARRSKAREYASLAIVNACSAAKDSGAAARKLKCPPVPARLPGGPLPPPPCGPRLPPGGLFKRPLRGRRGQAWAPKAREALQALMGDPTASDNARKARPQPSLFNLL